MVSRDLEQKYIDQLESELHAQFAKDEGFNKIDKVSLGDDYYLFDGHLRYVMDKWATIVRKIDNVDYDLIVGATFTRINFVDNKECHQVMMVYKFNDSLNKAASKLYIEFSKKLNTVVLSDRRVTREGIYIWYELLTRPNLEKEGVRVFVYDTKIRKEVSDYGNINDLFGTMRDFEEIVIGIMPI